jgi:hypothetical protein
MRLRRFRFIPQMDTLSLRVAPSVSSVGAVIDSGDDCGDTVDWTQDADTTDSRSDSFSCVDPSATDGALDDLCGGTPNDPSTDPMTPQIPGDSVYTVATAVMPATAIC